VRFESVTSAQNRKVKTLLALQEKARLRKEMGLFVVEGRRELEHCVGAGFEIDTLFYCPEICGTDIPAAEQAIEVPKELYEKIACRGGTEGMIAEVKAKETGLAELKLSDKPLVVVLEGVEKPGNLGAVLRSADAAGVDAVLICDPLTDLYNPNLIRASIGAVFTVPVACCSSEEAIEWLKTNKINIYTAQLQDSSWYYDTDMRGGTAIVIGTESTGLTDVWREAADAHIRIPMLGELDSLNASVSAAILLFEAVRQRNA
jgi:TrmH family RNA methyltransferase